MADHQRRIPVNLNRNPYEVVVGTNLLKSIGEELKKINIKQKTKILVVTNKVINELYGEICLNSLIAHGYEPNLLSIDPGEDKKNLESISQIHDAAYKSQLERNSLMIALGGGVIGDMTGFAASTWLRGISVVQAPTTLLAMVDAAIGGKTGVNHPFGKNLIGTFHQPKLVLIDPKLLDSLPQREFQAGLAEVIKYGVITNPRLFKLLERQPKIKNKSDFAKQTIEEILELSIKAKAEVVVADEEEHGLRAILNYGHTFGHVIETLCGYGTWLHGEAVAIGMVAAGELAVDLNCWRRSDADRQKKLINKAGLPIKWPKLKLHEVLKTLQGDKKVVDGKIRFVIPTEIGKVQIRNDITTKDIEICLGRVNK